MGMGKKLDALLGRRSFNTAKFKATVNLAVSRLAVLKNQRQSRCSAARSDVVQLLNLGHHERALLRVEQVIKEQNMWDVLLMVQGYCHLLIERIDLLQHEKLCPEELKEAISSLIYAASRCGEFPELQELRAVFTSRFGKEFAARAVELRNNCGVTPKMIQKLSTKMPSLEHRVKVLKEIASEHNITLQIEEAHLETTEEKNDTIRKKDQPEKDQSSISGEYRHRIPVLPQGTEHEGGRKYKDVADAAQAAFESAAYAAAAARAAVELSRSESHDPDDPNGSIRKPRNVSDSREDSTSGFRTEEKNNEGVNFGDKVDELEQDKVKDHFKRSGSASSSDSADAILDDEIKGVGHDAVFYGINEEGGNRSRIESLKGHNNEVFGVVKSNRKDEILEGTSRNSSSHSTENQFSPVYRGGNEEEEPEGLRKQTVENLVVDNKPTSVRTRRTYHW